MCDDCRVLHSAGVEERVTSRGILQVIIARPITKLTLKYIYNYTYIISTLTQVHLH